MEGEARKDSRSRLFVVGRPAGLGSAVPIPPHVRTVIYIRLCTEFVRTEYMEMGSDGMVKRSGLFHKIRCCMRRYIHVCVRVRVCVCARACVCVCVCVLFLYFV